MKESYNFDGFNEFAQNKELSRLHLQAKLFHLMDFPLLKSNLNLNKSCKFLDAGCGDGTIASKIAQTFLNLDVYGLDKSEKLFSLSQEKKLDNLFFFNESLYNTSFPDNFFDFIYLRLVLQHIKEINHLMIEMKRILKKGGKICIVDIDDDLQIFYPNLQKLSECRYLIKHNYQSEGGDRFVGRKLPKILETFGFNNIKIDCKKLSTFEIKPIELYNIAWSFLPDLIKNQIGKEEIRTEIEENLDGFFALIVVLVMVAVK